MKCKWCGRVIKITSNGFGHTCYDGTHSYTVCEDGSQRLRIDGKEVDNLLKMRAEHAEQQKYIGAVNQLIKTQNLLIKDLTPPIKAGGLCWFVDWNGYVHSEKIVGMYKNKDGKWEVVYKIYDIVHGTFTEVAIYGETAFATKAEAERLNKKGE